MRMMEEQTAKELTVFTLNPLADSGDGEMFSVAGVEGTNASGLGRRLGSCIINTQKSQVSVCLIYLLITLLETPPL